MAEHAELWIGTKRFTGMPATLIVIGFIWAIFAAGVVVGLLLR